jgi:hypothetical protein
MSNEYVTSRFSIDTSSIELLHAGLLDATTAYWVGETDGIRDGDSLGIRDGESDGFSLEVPLGDDVGRYDVGAAEGTNEGFGLDGGGERDSDLHKTKKRSYTQ